MRTVLASDPRRTNRPSGLQMDPAVLTSAACCSRTRSMYEWSATSGGVLMASAAFCFLAACSCSEVSVQQMRIRTIKTLRKTFTGSLTCLCSSAAGRNGDGMKSEAAELHTHRKDIPDSSGLQRSCFEFCFVDTRMFGKDDSIAWMDDRNRKLTDRKRRSKIGFRRAERCA